MSVSAGLTSRRALPWWICAVGLLALYVPTVIDLTRNIWTTEEQSQGPIVLAICAWLTWRAWARIDDDSAGQTRPVLGWLLAVIAMLLYAFGRSQRILSAQTLSVVFMLPA